ncbi:hypothetical protein NPIL_702701 [Nephila pilipes]|uniref:Uncharacterized protein n=1 Tax=Nephila pilipes TaxID=299642 RepID=A0A8X6N117_NEPPI|nr:hypothetical protein NPIL_702701 [Nephila pilipes]
MLAKGGEVQTKEPCGGSRALEKPVSVCGTCSEELDCLTPKILHTLQRFEIEVGWEVLSFIPACHFPQGYPLLSGYARKCTFSGQYLAFFLFQLCMCACRLLNETQRLDWFS